MQNSIERIAWMLPVGILCMTLNLLLVSAQTMSGGNFRITSSAHASGGGTSTGSGNKIIEGTAGQTVAGGPVNGSVISHESGFWPAANATPTPVNNGSPTFQFSQLAYTAQENLGALTLTVTRSGDASATASVDYQTIDAGAMQKADFEYAAGTLVFAPGETIRTFTLLLNEDMYPEGNESFNVTLSNPAGAILGAQSTASVTIVDDAPESISNPVDDAQSFVYSHYHDFLNREPDAAGLDFWTNQITSCGADAQCIDSKRVNVSAAFFLSIEFQETGYLLYLMEKESFTSMPKYTAFMRDLQEVSQGVIVNAPGWEQKLKDNQQQFAARWISRPAFKAIYDGMSNTQYVNALCANAGISVSQNDRQTLVNALDTASESRAAVLLDVAGNAAFRQKEQSAAFVMMQYFGYLRRDPNASPDSDLSGYNFWLKKLNEFAGDYINAEMVRSFIISSEYRQRFGQ